VLYVICFCAFDGVTVASKLRIFPAFYLSNFPVQIPEERLAKLNAGFLLLLSFLEKIACCILMSATTSYYAFYLI
jgi:hypothetical protein